MKGPCKKMFLIKKEWGTNCVALPTWIYPTSVLCYSQVILGYYTAEQSRCHVLQNSRLVCLSQQIT